MFDGMNGKNWAIQSAGYEANFIANMRIFRERLSWSQGDMAKQMQAAGWEGFHQTTISRIEKGDRPVRLSEASGIALVLGVEMWQMVLADEASRPLRELEKSIEQLRRLGLILGENVRDYLFYQSLIRKELDDIDELTWGAEGHGFNPQFIQKRDELKMAAARLLSRTYMEDIDEFMRSENGDQDGTE